MKRVLSVLLIAAVLIGTLPTYAGAYSTDYPNTWANTGNQANDIVQIALSQVGYHETGNNHTKYNAWFYQYDNPVAWCAIFISWCANQANIPTSVIAKNASSNKGSFQTATYGFSSAIQPGDIAYIGKTGGSNSSHVGLVVEVTASSITTVEGNYSDQVKRCTYNRNTGTRSYTTAESILFFGRPNYSGSGEVTPPVCTAHIKGTYLWAEGAHPHYRYWNCGKCGASFTDGSTEYSASCSQCNPASSSHATIKIGSSGSDVSLLQTLLNQLQNASLIVDGQFGPATQAAVKTFQQFQGLAADGICGPATWAALENAASVGKTSKPSVSVNGQDVTVSWTYSGTGDSIAVYLVQDPWAWADIKHCFVVSPDITSHTFTGIDPGFYQAFIIAQPNAANIQSDWTEFTVQQPHIIHEKGEFRYTSSEHPHYNYYACSVCSEEFTDSSTTPDYSCSQCHSEHIKGDFRYTAAEHPHYNYYACSLCGQEFSDGSTTPDNSCLQCFPEPPVDYDPTPIPPPDGFDPTPVPPSFTDVAPGAYYAQPVIWAYHMQITLGTSPTTFSPSNPCTRAQIVTFLWRSAGRPEAARPSSFEDVPADGDFKSAIDWAVEQGITNGTGPSTFSPNAPCTRDQAVTFLWRAAGKPTPAVASSFTDAPVSGDFKTAIDWAVEKGITNGTSPTKFSPKRICTRGDIVTFLYRYTEAGNT